MKRFRLSASGGLVVLIVLRPSAELLLPSPLCIIAQGGQCP